MAVEIVEFPMVTYGHWFTVRRDQIQAIWTHPSSSNLCMITVGNISYALGMPRADALAIWIKEDE